MPGTSPTPRDPQVLDQHTRDDISNLTTRLNELMGCLDAAPFSNHELYQLIDQRSDTAGQRINCTQVGQVMRTFREIMWSLTLRQRFAQFRELMRGEPREPGEAKDGKGSQQPTTA